MFAVIKGHEAKGLLVAAGQTAWQLLKTNELKPAAEYLHMESRLTPREDMFVDDDTAGFEPVHESEQQGGCRRSYESCS